MAGSFHGSKRRRQGKAGSAGGRGSSRAAAGPAAGRRPASSRLDQKTINGSLSVPPSEVLLIIGCKCRSWCCPSCGPGYWAKIGARITPHLGMFIRPRLLTLTIDRKQFASGRDAYIIIRDKIRTFLRLFKFKKAFAVMAFHPAAPEWPHWHILIDLADCGNWVNLKRMWRIWRDDWGIGGFDLNVKKSKLNATQAARYALGYCQHQAGVVGEWVKASERLPRAFECYGDLRKALRADAALPDDDAADSANDSSEPAPEPRRRRLTRLVRDRLKVCGLGSAVLHRRTDSTGQSTYRYLGSISETPGSLALAAVLGQVGSLTVHHRRRDLSNGTQVLDVSIPVAGQDPRDLFDQLESTCRTLALLRPPPPDLPDELTEPEPPESPDCPAPDGIEFGSDGIAPF